MHVVDPMAWELKLRIFQLDPMAWELKLCIFQWDPMAGILCFLNIGVRKLTSALGNYVKCLVFQTESECYHYSN